MSIKFLDAKTIPDAFNRIESINKSIGWSKYTRGVQKYLNRVGSEFLFAESQGVKCGYIAGRDDDDEYAWYISYIAVAKESQGQGIGSALMLKMIEIAQAKFKTTLHLHCEEGDYKFYETFAARQGFFCERAEDGFYLNDEPRSDVKIYFSQAAERTG